MIDHNTNMPTEILQRYFRKDEQGNVIETLKQMFRRVANVIAAIESKYGTSDNQVKAIADGFYKLMMNGIFLPNSPTLMNAGLINGMLSACFVLPIEDSIEGIFGLGSNQGNKWGGCRYITIPADVRGKSNN